MSEINPANDIIQYIPKDGEGDGVQPISHWVVSEIDIINHRSNISKGDVIQSLPITDATVAASTPSLGLDDLVVSLIVTGAADQVGLETQNVTFSVGTTLKNDSVTVPTYQWQKKENGTNDWVNISGATQSQYTVTNISVANDNGDQYRCIVSAATAVNSPLTSRAGTLSVKRLITITQQPTAQPSYSSGSTATFSVAATISSGSLSYQWQKRDYSTANFVSISGATNSTYTTPALSVSEDSQDNYRCMVFAENADTVYSNSVTLSIAGADLQISPAVSGVTFWSFADNGPLILDPVGTNTYNVTVLERDKNIRFDMWGQGSCNATGGYSTGFVPVSVGSGYTVKVNAGGGTGGNPGGGYAGLFKTNVASQETAILIAGGAGGGGLTSAGCTYSGGTGGGLDGGNAEDLIGTGTSATYTAASENNYPTQPYGWYTRSGGIESNPYSGVRQLVIRWNGSTVYDGPGVSSGPVIVDGYAYYPSTNRPTSLYGWSADYNNAFDVYRVGGSLDGGGGASQTNAGRGASTLGGGELEYTVPGTYTWTAPEGVTSVSLVCIGGAASGAGGLSSPNRAQGGGGAGLIYANNVPVTPGTTYTIQVGSGGIAPTNTQNHNFVPGSATFFRLNGSNQITANASTDRYGAGGSIIGFAGASAVAYTGGTGGQGIINDNGSGSAGVGGGAANYSSNGENGGQFYISSGTGPGTGIFGDDNGNYGGGGNGSFYTWSPGTSGQNGALRIIWPGNIRSYPSTNVTGTFASSDGSNGSALQGGNGGVSTYIGGGGGGGYFGGGGGGGTGDKSTGGGGGAGFVSTSVFSGVTSGFAAVDHPNRGNAGAVGQNSRVVLFMSKITITSQPTLNANYNTGDNATISVSATISSGSINYQWQRKAIDGDWQNIAGANTNSYTISSITINNNLDKYRCVLSNPSAITEYTNDVVLYVRGVDIQVSPAVNGKTFWSFLYDGKLILDASNSTSYTITLLNSEIEKLSAKMWGQGRSNGTGGYSSGIIPVTTNQVISARLNAGGGSAGTSYGWPGREDGGGYAGLFNGTNINQGSAIMIAGGAGGSGFGHSSTAGGHGGGSSGDSGQSSSDSQIGSTGGGGGSQSSGGGGGGAGGQSGSALQGGRGGDGVQQGHPNAGGGGGGGGGYFGGGGGGGGNDAGSGTRTASAGGGGSGFISGTVISGVTTKFANTIEGGFNDPDRGGAGGTNSNSRIVIDQFSEYYTDSSGRILILSCTSATRDPRTLTKTRGKVLIGSNSVIDDARWQSWLNLASTGDYRLAVTLNNSSYAILPARPNNLQTLKNANRLSIRTSLTDWQPFLYGYRLAWDENTGDEGVGSDYSGLFWGETTYQGWAYYAVSSNPPFSANINPFEYSVQSANWWILPPGVPDFPIVTGQQAYTSPGTYSWTAPAGVKSVSVVCISGGGGGGPNNGGNGGSLGWKNNIPVVPGQSYTVVVGRGGFGGSNDFSYRKGGDSYFISLTTVGAQGSGGLGQLIGQYYGDGGGNGGSGYWGGGGAGGYTGNGGGFNGSTSISPTGGGGGHGGNGSFPSGDGGGVGIFGQGSNGFNAGGSGSGGAGSGGSGNLYGGGGGVGNGDFGGNNGGGGAVRIIWGPNRAFPSTNTQNMTPT